MIIFEKIKNETEIASIQEIQKYIENVEYNKLCTYHSYENCLPQNINNKLHIIKNGTILETLYSNYKNTNIESIVEMNEIYVSTIGSTGSDKVFESQHLDGPFWGLLGCNVYRCILAIQGNRDIITKFPSQQKSYVVDTYDFLAFDYNRDIHYILKNDSTDNRTRMILKLHYIVCKKWVPRYIIIFYSKLH